MYVAGVLPEHAETKPFLQALRVICTDAFKPSAPVKERALLNLGLEYFQRLHYGPYVLGALRTIQLKQRSIAGANTRKNRGKDAGFSVSSLLE